MVTHSNELYFLNSLPGNDSKHPSCFTYSIIKTGLRRSAVRSLQSTTQERTAAGPDVLLHHPAAARCQTVGCSRHFSASTSKTCAGQSTQGSAQKALRLRWVTVMYFSTAWGFAALLFKVTWCKMCHTYKLQCKSQENNRHNSSKWERVSNPQNKPKIKTNQKKKRHDFHKELHPI